MSYLAVRRALLSCLLLLLALSWGCAEALESEEELVEVNQALLSPQRPTSNVWRAGQGLCSGQSVTTFNSIVNQTIVMQGDGNLVVYDNQRNLARWASHTAGKRVGGQLARCAVMQGDGNFVLYTAAGLPVWHTGTNGNPGATAEFSFYDRIATCSPRRPCAPLCFPHLERSNLRIERGTTLIRRTTGSITCR